MEISDLFGDPFGYWSAIIELLNVFCFFQMFEFNVGFERRILQEKEIVGIDLINFDSIHEILA